MSVADPLPDSLTDVLALLVELNRLLSIEREHRVQFAYLLAATRLVLAAADAGEPYAALRLRIEVERHREITSEELDAWRGWSSLVTPCAESFTQSSEPDRKEALTN